MSWHGGIFVLAISCISPMTKMADRRTHLRVLFGVSLLLPCAHSQLPIPTGPATTTPGGIVLPPPITTPSGIELPPGATTPNFTILTTSSTTTSSIPLPIPTVPPPSPPPITLPPPPLITLPPPPLITLPPPVSSTFTPVLPPLITTPSPTITPSPSLGVLVCVPIGTCPPNPNTAGIDVRITSTLVCPAGQEPCASPTAGGNQCGVRYIQNFNTADGSSTPGSYPWQAYLTNPTQFIGSGVLIDQMHILTAAHKVYTNVNSPQNIGVALGVWDPAMQGNVQNRTGSRIVVHPNFENTTLRNDIAVVRLNSPVALGTQANIGVACLPSAGQVFTGRSCMVAGWGVTQFTSNDAPTRPQKQVSVPIVTYQACRNSMMDPTVLGSNVDVYLDPLGEICAGGEENRDACTVNGLFCPGGATVDCSSYICTCIPYLQI